MKDQDNVNTLESIEDQDNSQDKQTFWSRKIVIALIIVILLFIAFGVIFYNNNDAVDANANKPVDQNALENSAQEGVVDKIIFYDMDEIVVNVENKGKNNHFLKIKVTLEMDTPQDLKVVKKMMPKINDIFLIYLRTLRLSDLQGSVALYRLREEMMMRINKIISPAKINDVLFKEMLVQ